ncbi:islet cell autoantigen 1 [Bradysia coprophila]|uniref:islet cell autoantigen 1 n=1 Tax=Bradysia coprophila TaxID=38358 RepID=UPI00187D965B|nr:islet cell autoantigen 1 [Bradysia coprophila]
MLNSEKYWVTKHIVQRKLGKKDDVCIESSDAELDSKIDLFKSINESCLNLHRIIDSYQERICIVAQEENSVGKFLKETGKGSATSGKPMNTAGKSLSYCGQQRMTVRAPLMRLHHELETFRNRAISDTHHTIQAMEKERTEYRAALNWMKSASAQLDPDTGRGLEKFRKAQQHVRASKTKFDKLTLDCLQKIDLLAAARCNMFSHVLVAYQSTMLEFANKTMDTFNSAMTALEKEPHYSFTILKELTQGSDAPEKESQLAAVDSDQMLFFKDDYKDDITSQPNEAAAKTTDDKKDKVLPSELIDVTDGSTNQSESVSSTVNITNDQSLVDTSTSTDLLKMMSESDFGDFVSSTPYMPSQLLMNDLATFSFDDAPTDSTKAPPMSTESSAESVMKVKNSILQLFNKTSSTPSTTSDETDADKKPTSQQSKSRKDKSAWYDLFADLDPLANPETLEKKLSENSQAA